MHRATLPLLVLLAACGSGEKPAPIKATPPAKAPPREPEPARVVLDLLAARPLAHVHLTSSQVIDGGSAAFWKHIDGGWKTPWFPAERDGDHRVALVGGIAGVVRFPVDRDGDGAGGDKDGDLRLSFTIRPAVPKQALSVFLNEKPVGNLSIEEGYKTYDVTLPKDKLLPGENAVRFHFRAAGTIAGRHTAAAFERISVGPRGTADPGPAPRLGAELTLGGDARRALAATSDARFSYYLLAPPATRLELGYGAPAGSAKVLVRATVDGQGPKELWSGQAGGTWQKAVVDLSSLAGKPARLDLISRGGGAAFATPRLVSDVKPVERPKVKPADHVVVWMIDTLRADRLTAYDPKSKVKTPGLDQLAREATRFLRTSCQGNYSLPSHTSLLTGVLPPNHGMWEDKDRLSPDLPLSSQQFQKAGFATALFSSNGYVSDKWGFKKGWDAYRNFIREEKPNSADEVWKAARPWLQDQVKAGKRTYMYLATVDPHVAYNPPERFLKEYWPKPYKGPIKPVQTSEQLYQIKINKLKLTDEDKRYLEALYNAEVTQNDAAFLQMVGDLKQMGIYDRTAIVVISDHGDEFYDHGSVGHGHSLYQELIDVPLLVRYPGLYPEGKAVKDAADLTDVYSTVLDLAGLAPNVEAQGEALSPLALDDGPRMERTTRSYHAGAIRAERLGGWKLITWAGTRLALYDLDTDPGEKKDLAGERPIALRLLRDAFSIEHAYEKRWKKSRWGSGSALRPGAAEEMGM